MSSFQKPTTTHELKQRLLTTIDKLSDRATFSQASSELTFLANSLSLDFLPTFLSCILSIDSSSKSPVRVHCINLISQLSNTHKSNLLPHIPKIIPFFLRRLRDSDTSVRHACVSAVSKLSELSFNPILESFLSSVSTEQDLNAQIGCCLCLKAAIESGCLDECNESDLRKRVLPKVIKLVKGDGFKAKGGLLGVIEGIVGVNNGSVVNNNGNGNGNGNGKCLVGNVVGVVVEMMSSEDWMARKAAAEVLVKMALVLDEESAADVKGFVVTSLESRRFDKVKVTREIMNRALEAWKEVSGGPDQQISLSRSNSSISKDNSTSGASTPIPRRFSYGGFETPKPKKRMAKCRSSLSDGPVPTFSPSLSPSTKDSISSERRTLSKTRSSLSDDSTITDSSSVSNSEAPFSKKPGSKGKPSLPDNMAVRRSPSKMNDWKVEIAVPPAPCGKVVSEDEESNNLKDSEERVLKYNTSTTTQYNPTKYSAFRNRSRVVPFVEEDDRRGFDFEVGGSGKVGERDVDEDLSLIRKQLQQIEKQQSDLLALVQRFMGNSQNGIDSLETRVSGLERALDEISHDLAIQSGRFTNNASAASTCCPSTEFLSQFWRRTEGRSFNSKSSMPHKEALVETPTVDGYKNSEHNEGIFRDSWGSVKSNCSPRSFDSASTPACITSVGRGA